MPTHNVAVTLGPHPVVNTLTDLKAPKVGALDEYVGNARRG